MSKAAKELKVDRATITRKVRKHKDRYAKLQHVAITQPAVSY